MNLGKYSMFLLRFCVAAILVVHGLFGMLQDGLEGFGTYLDSQGFASYGLLLAWILKVSHLLTAVSLMVKKWLIWTCSFTILILLFGIIMVHLPNGWFVVGGGFNGIEFNLLIISALFAIMFEGLHWKQYKDH